jgi:hypothetical protein
MDSSSASDSSSSSDSADEISIRRYAGEVTCVSFSQYESSIELLGIGFQNIGLIATIQYVRTRIHVVFI